MSSISEAKSSNPMPVDLAERLGMCGVREILSVLWQAYGDLKAAKLITADMHENSITQEWYMRIYRKWNSDNRAAKINLNLTPIHQYEDEAMAKPGGTPPTIDFCFRAWNKDDGYFGVECKNLYENDSQHIKRYVETGVNNYVSGRYGSSSSASAIAGYILSGNISDIIIRLGREIKIASPQSSLSPEPALHNNQYKSCHMRLNDGVPIMIYHLFLDFVS